ncbi:MAG: hypothetical protein A2Y36_11810 [Treponema sp. GWA1_62_8]|nr:MAG: hypothetical protein A2Y36_11810 [Treponema sp. GWA1_62_8]OHE65711.1 MAG: hypothetical protein A2001_14945 [Treponema sp. GWC1_61_84]
MASDILAAMWNLSKTTAAVGQHFLKAARYGFHMFMTQRQIRLVLSSPNHVKKASKLSCFRFWPLFQMCLRASGPLATYIYALSTVKREGDRLRLLTQSANDLLRIADLVLLVSGIGHSGPKQGQKSEPSKNPDSRSVIGFMKSSMLIG